MSSALQWLRTSGPDVAGADGTPVRLRGVGIGGWLNMENFITGYPSTESAHRQALRKVLGERRHDLFFESFLGESFAFGNCGVSKDLCELLQGAGRGTLGP